MDSEEAFARIRENKRRKKFKNLQKEIAWRALLKKTAPIPKEEEKTKNKKNRNRAIADKRADVLAEQTGGKSHIGSGSFWWKKSDASSDDFFQYEDKFTREDYIYIKSDVLEKIEHEALSIGRIPVLSFGFIVDNITTDYIIMRKQDCFFEEEPLYLKNITTKSFKLTADELMKLNIYNKRKVMAQFELSGRKYVILTRSEFVENKDKILNGELL